LKDQDKTGDRSTPRTDGLRVEAEGFQCMFENHGAVMYIVDLASFRLIDANKSAVEFYGYDRDTLLTKRIPDLNIMPEQVIRAEIKRAVEEGRSYYLFQHRLASGEIRDVEVYANPIEIEGKAYSFSIVHDVTARKRIEQERVQLITELKTALEEVNTLRGILPICSFCKKVRDDQGFWNQVEDYIVKHSEADFSHSVCPSCTREYYPAHLKWLIAGRWVLRKSNEQIKRAQI
jgi:PAS domain S-box-containing protein